MATKEKSKPKSKPKGDGVKWVNKNCPPELVARFLEDNTNWDPEAIPPLFGIVEAPTLRKDGTVLDEAGYDRATGIYFDPGYAEFPKIADKPTYKEGKAAIDRVAELLVDFPFVDQESYEGVSKAVALAAIMTGPVRRCLDLAPAFAATANEAETGKTELTLAIAGVTVGRMIAGQPFSGNEEECRKALGAALIDGRPALLFDNVDDVTIGGSFFEQVLTMPKVTDRILGSTKTYTAPTHVLMLFNGNHLTVSGAATTRVLMTRLLSTTPLAKRRFKYPNLFAHVIANRPSLVADVLTALRAWIVARPPTDSKRDTLRFPEWDRLIAQALIWYGYADPVRGGDELREVDPVKEAQRQVIRMWAESYGDVIVTAAALLPPIKQAVADAKRMKVVDVTAMHVAKYVGTLIDARLDMDWRVVKLPGNRRAGEPARWRLEWSGEPASQPENPSTEGPASDFEPGDE